MKRTGPKAVYLVDEVAGDASREQHNVSHVLLRLTEKDALMLLNMRKTLKEADNRKGAAHHPALAALEYHGGEHMLVFTSDLAVVNEHQRLYDSGLDPDFGWYDATPDLSDKTRQHFLTIVDPGHVTCRYIRVMPDGVIFTGLADEVAGELESPHIPWSIIEALCEKPRGHTIPRRKKTGPARPRRSKKR